MLQRSVETVKELREITIKTDTRDILSHATIQAEALEDYFLVDIDAHVTETQFWPEILDLIDNDVIRHMGPSRGVTAGHFDGVAQCPAGHVVSARLRPHPASGRSG